jgi:uncharacterized repeat protein (TIGR03803 family)
MNGTANRSSGIGPRRALAAIVLAGAFASGRAEAAPSLATLYSFGGGLDGSHPEGELAIDAAGALYGTTCGANCGGTGKGTVFRLTPPPGGQGAWSETILYRFGAAATLMGGVSLNPKGRIYGTSDGGGAAGGGYVFKLRPPASGTGPWLDSTLYAFAASKGPVGRPLLDADGNVYAAAPQGGPNSAGSVFRLRPPTSGATPWYRKVLTTFGAAPGQGQAPRGNLVFDGAGNLDGTTVLGGAGSSGSGTVYQLQPPAAGETNWTQLTLYEFAPKNLPTDGANPTAGVVVDSQGNLYGTTSYGGTNGTAKGGCGTIFELSPPVAPATAWTETVLYDFACLDDGARPLAGLVPDGQGNLYGTTSEAGSGQAGTVFELSPPATGQTAWTFTLLYGFSGGSDGGQPVAGLALDEQGRLYGTTTTGGANGGGTVFQLIP